MECTNCGNTVSDCASWCEHCGYQLKPEESSNMVISQEWVDNYPESQADYQDLNSHYLQQGQILRKPVNLLRNILLSIAALLIISLLVIASPVKNIFIAEKPVPEESTVFEAINSDKTNHTNLPGVSGIGPEIKPGQPTNRTPVNEPSEKTDNIPENKPGQPTNPAPANEVNLVATDIAFNKADLAIGNQIFFDTGVQNTGNTGSNSFNIKWLVNDQQLGYGYHNGIPANKTVMNGNSQLIWTPAKDGNYIIKFVVDCDNEVIETNENDNVKEVTLNIPGPKAPAKVTFFEAEQLDPTVSGGQLQTQAMDIFPAGSWSGNSQLWWTGGKTDDILVLFLPVTKEGLYEVSASFTLAPDYGIVSIYLDAFEADINLIDLYGPEVKSTGLLNLGIFDLTAENHRLLFILTGHNPAAFPAQMVGVDLISLRYLGE